jgi:CBS domain containing-hemolysin-like protein
MHIVLGELAPKSFAIQRALPTALLVAYPLHLFYRLMYPFIAVLNAAGNLLVRAIGLQPATEVEHAHSPQELALLLVDAGETGALEPGERDVARRALTLGERSVRTAMIPRTEIVSVPETASIAEVLAVSAAHPFTRLPVHHEDRDEIVGVIHVRDLAHAAARAGATTAAGLMRPVALLPETTDLLEALATFRRERVVVGVVLDEHGGTSGIVTLGAIAEHLLGPVGDEFVPARTFIERRPDGSLLVDGRAPIADVRDALGVELAGVSADTAAGFVVERLGRMAEPGDVVQEEGVTFKVLEIDGHRIERIAITRPSRQQPR